MQTCSKHKKLKLTVLEGGESQLSKTKPKRKNYFNLGTHTTYSSKKLTMQSWMCAIAEENITFAHWMFSARARTVLCWLTHMLNRYEIPHDLRYVTVSYSQKASGQMRIAAAFVLQLTGVIRARGFVWASSLHESPASAQVCQWLTEWFSPCNG